ncbi:hypothetical protein Gpo141_00008794 [Globisporangium polare]
MRLWSLLYASSLLVSSVAAAVIATSIYRHSELRVSAVRSIFFFFFVYLWLWSLFRGVFYVDVFLLDDQSFAAQFIGDDGYYDSEYYDALGLRGVAQVSNLTRPWLSFILVVGDTCLMASSLWMFPMTWELSRLARKSMDRGALRERLAARWYCKWLHALTLLFFLAEAAYTIANHGFNTRSYRILVSGNMIQLVALVYVTYTLVNLKLSGRKYETINGAQVASPLYRRIKGIMIVYGLFSFQYQIISLVLLCSNFDVAIPTLVVGVSTLLFNNSGTALAIAIGCSQECFYRSFQRYVPEEYAEAFYVSDPSLPMNSGANRNTPPLHNPVFVYTDIESSTQLWGFQDGAIMKPANEIHEQVVRYSLAEFRGYEITTCGDAFQLAFHNVKDAVEYCAQVQFKLLEAEWPKKLHNLIPSTARKKTKAKKLIFSGLRLRMGIHDAQQQYDGVLVNAIHPVTGKVTYTGLSEVIANEIGDVGMGGQICVTSRVAAWISEHGKMLKVPCEVERASCHLISQLNLAMDVFQVVPRGLETRKKAYQRYWDTRLESIKVDIE